MVCHGINNRFCIERNIGPLGNPELFCALCPAENKIVPVADIVVPARCKYGNYTGKPFTGCSTCGGTIIECVHEKIWPKTRNSKICNSTCKHWKLK